MVKIESNHYGSELICGQQSSMTDLKQTVARRIGSCFVELLVRLIETVAIDRSP